MDSVNMAKSMRGCLGALADWLCGCAHSRTTFPMTLKVRVAQSETYVVCLECGRHFAYDWTTMQIAQPRLAWAAPPALRPALGEARRGLR